MNKRPAFQFYPADWIKDPDLQMCSMSTIGIWINLICRMWEAKEQGKVRGTKEEICQIVGCTISELALFFDDNNFHKFANVTKRNKKVTIINRRMYKDYIERESVKKRVSRHREKRKRKCNAKVTPYSSSSPSSSLSPEIERMLQEEGKSTIHPSQKK